MELDEAGAACAGQAFRREVFQYYVTDLDRGGRRRRAEQEKRGYVVWITQTPV